MRIRSVITTAVVTLLAALGAVTASGSTLPAPDWGPLQPYGSGTVVGSTPSNTIAIVTSVACPSYGKCVAAGIDDTTSAQEGAVVAVENGAGQWGQPIAAPLPSNSASNAGPVFTSVACSSATACVAVGSYTTSANGDQPLAVPFTVSGSTVSYGTPQEVALPGNALMSSGQGAFLAGVSCTVGGCTAVGTYKTTGNVWTAITATPSAGGAWTSTAVSAPPGATNDILLNAISCPSSGACEAVGNYGDSSGNLQEWAVQVVNGVAGAAQAVTFAGSGTLTASSPSPSGGLNLRSGLTAVSCPSAGVCTAVGTIPGSSGGSSTPLPLPVVLPISGGAPGPSSTFNNDGLPALADAEGISCSDATDCTAVGVRIIYSGGGEAGVAVAASEIGGSWSALADLPGGPTPIGGGSLTLTAAAGVACTAPSVCVAGGLSISSMGSGATEGSFFAYSGLPAAITTTSLPAATVGKPYSATLQGSGGTGTASWAVALGSLPAGLTLNASTGVISGTPTAAGQSGFAVAETTAGPPSLTSAATSLSITVASAAPVSTISLAYSKVSGRSVVLVLNCSGAPCDGALTVAGVEHLRGSKPIAVDARASKKPRTRAVTLASRGYSLAAGADTTIVVKLNAKGAKLLRQLHRISTKLALTPAGAAAPALVKTLTFKSRR